MRGPCVVFRFGKARHEYVGGEVANLDVNKGRETAPTDGPKNKLVTFADLGREGLRDTTH